MHRNEQLDVTCTRVGIDKPMIRPLHQELHKVRRLHKFLAEAVAGLWRHRYLSPNSPRAACAEWLHQSCARGLKALSVHLEIQGTAPKNGLIVSNHLSYLDILAYS